MHASIYIHSSYIHIQTDRQADMDTYIHTYIHTHILTYTHTYIHTYRQTDILSNMCHCHNLVVSIEKDTYR